MAQQTYTNTQLIGTTPTAPQDYVTMQWVEDYVAGKVKAPVRVVSAANLAGTYDPGTKTFTLGTTGELVIDSVPLATGDRLFLAKQTDAKQNGIYIVTVSGGASTAAILTRAADFDDDDEVFSGVRITVSEGTLYSDTTWKLSTAGIIVLDVTALDFIQVASATGAQKYAATITGDNLKTVFEIEHELGTTDLDVSVWNLATNSKVLTDITIVDNGTITVSFAAALSTAQSFRVVVIG